MSEFDKLYDTSVKVIVRLRGKDNALPNQADQKKKQNQTKNLSAYERYQNIYQKKTSKSREKSPLKNKTFGLDEETKYTMFTSSQKSDIVLISKKPIKGKSINENFKTKTDLYDFSQTILKETTLLQFDQVYNESHKVDTLYNDYIKRNITNLIHGKNACVLLFGPRDSGKSYLLRGASDQKQNECGILARAINDIFNLISLSKQSSNSSVKNFFAIKISAYQVYLDNVNDLLAREFRQIRTEKFYDQGGANCNLIGLTRKEIRNKAEYDSCVKEAVHQRKTLISAMNCGPDIKRKSHLVISIIVEKKTRYTSNDETTESTIDNFAQIDFVELASSNYGLVEIDENDSSTDAILYKNTAKVFNSLCNNIVSANNNVTPKNECKLTLCLKKTIRPHSSIVFINCAVPWEFPISDSFRSLKFSNWVRNQVINMYENIEERKENDVEEYEKKNTNEGYIDTNITEPRFNSVNANGSNLVRYQSMSQSNPNMRSINHHLVKTPNENKILNNFYDSGANNNNASEKEEKIENPGVFRSIPSSRIEKSMQELKNKATDISHSIENLRKENTNLRNPQNVSPIETSVLNNMAMADADKMKQDYATMKSDNIILKEDVNRLKEMNRHLENQLNEERQRNMNLVAENERLDQSRVVLEKQIKDLTEPQAPKEETLLDKLNARYMLERDNRDIKDELNRVRQEKSQIEVDFRVLQERYEEISRSYNELNAMFSTMKNSHNNEVNQIEDKITLMTNEIEKLQRENSVLRASEEKMRFENTFKARENEEYKQKYDDEKYKNDILSKKLQEIERDLLSVMREKENERIEREKEEEMKKLRNDSKAKIMGELQKRITNYKNNRLKNKNEL